MVRERDPVGATGCRRTGARRYAAALCIGALALSPARPAAQEPAVAEVGTSTRFVSAVEASRSLLTALVREANLPGLQVAVARSGEVVWSEGFGYADLEQRARVSSRTRFRIGSLSKPLTAAALLTLHEAGTLDLDASVRRYVPSFPEKAYMVTPRQLAGHLGGIRHYREDETQLRYRTYGHVVEALELFADDPLLHRPGTAYEYSSYGYNLLGAVIQGASGRGYLTYMREAVFEPLGMAHTVADHVDSIIPYRARFYAESDADGRLLNAPFTDNSYKWPSGGFLSTAEDLVRFATGLPEGRLLTDESLALLFGSMTTLSGDSTGYGMGWRPRRDSWDRRVVRHGGSSVGGRAFLLLYPDDGLAVAILVNASLAPVFQEEAEPVAHFFLDHAAAGDRIGADAPVPAGTYRFTARRGDEDVTGTLYLSGDRVRPGWMDWDDAARPVPLVVLDDHGDEVLVYGAGVHGMLTLRATFEAGGFDGQWNWLGRTGPITGELQP